MPSALLISGGCGCTAASFQYHEASGSVGGTQRGAASARFKQKQKEEKEKPERRAVADALP